MIQVPANIVITERVGVLAAYEAKKSLRAVDIAFLGFISVFADPQHPQHSLLPIGSVWVVANPLWAWDGGCILPFGIAKEPAEGVAPGFHLVGLGVSLPRNRLDKCLREGKACSGTRSRAEAKVPFDRDFEGRLLSVKQIRCGENGGPIRK